MKKNNFNSFDNLKFDDYKKRANDNTLSKYEKIGFPDSYRKDKESFIFEDLKTKLKNLNLKNKIIMDIGCGCSELPLMIIELCKINKSKLILVDSEEMLNLLPNYDFIEKVPCFFPDCQNILDKYINQIDVILAYSLLQIVILEQNIFNFIDQSLKLLSNDGEFLLGDIPNISKRKRFFLSEKGIKYHQDFTKTEEIPQINFNCIEENKIDDSIIGSILLRARIQGFHSYILPQADNLPMANRREDILIKKP